MGERNTLYCSFCGKSQHEVKKLIAGPSVFICDECVDECNDIIEGGTNSGNHYLPGKRELREDLDGVSWSAVLEKLSLLTSGGSALGVLESLGFALEQVRDDRAVELYEIACQEMLGADRKVFDAKSDLNRVEEEARRITEEAKQKVAEAQEELDRIIKRKERLFAKAEANQRNAKSSAFT